MTRIFNSAMKRLYTFTTIVVWWSVCCNAYAVASSDMLLHIVEQCTHTSRAGYCEKCLAPQASAMCSQKTSCRATSEIWHETPEYVAMRDIKMCGCPSDFVHGLVLPRARVTGVEDANRPDGIWQFSWDIAKEKIPRNEIALAVNPRTRRSQNQLHVHLVKLKEGAASRFLPTVTAHTQNLNNVWTLAANVAKTNDMADYGVLVVADKSSGYLVVVSRESPEALFTHAYCTP
jgi:CDP-diacylglycerol pyrophosphatase